MRGPWGQTGPEHVPIGRVAGGWRLEHSEAENADSNENGPFSSFGAKEWSTEGQTHCSEVMVEKTLKHALILSLSSRLQPGEASSTRNGEMN